MTITFDAGPDRDGPMTWGQRKIFNEHVAYPDDEHLPFLRLQVPVPHGRSLEHVREALETLLVTHESLRTMFPTGTSQRLLGSGRLHAVTAETSGDPATAAAELLRSFCVERFDFPRELPFRAGVVTREGVPAVVVAVFSHMAVDGIGNLVLADQVRALLDSPAQKPPCSLQPLELAARQQSATGRRRGARALQYWESAYREAPQAMLVAPGAAQAVPSYCEGRMTSGAVAAALDVVANRTRTSSSAVLLAAVSALLGVRSSLDRCTLTSISANRPGDEMADHIGTLAQDAIVTLDLGAETFDDLVRHAWGAALRGYANSPVDPDAQQSVRAAVERERGTLFTRDFVYSDMSRNSPDADGSGQTQITMHDATYMWVRGYFTAYRLAPVAELSFWADERYVPRDDVVTFLRGLEKLLTTAAEGDVERVRLGEVAGVRPVALPPNWVRVGPSWVDLDQAQAVLDLAVGPGAGKIVPEDGTLTAHVASPGLSPEEVHLACTARLSEFDAAAAASRYVVSERP